MREAIRTRLDLAASTMSAAGRFAVELLLVGLVAIVDAATGPLVALSLFNVLIVAFTTWYSSIRQGYAISVVAATAGFLADGLQDSDRLPLYALSATFRLALYLIIVTLLNRLREAIDRERTFARVDPLTSLANRREFEDVAKRELARAKRTGWPLTLVYIDLDGFKRVNDSEGHAEGDEVLRATANLLASEVRGSDLVARVGGDEFVAMLVDAPEETVPSTVARLQEALNKHLGKWGVSATVGTARSNRTTVSPRELLAEADRAMYQAKPARSR